MMTLFFPDCSMIKAKWGWGYNMESEIIESEKSDGKEMRKQNMQMES
jgi:hypothetical protein